MTTPLMTRDSIGQNGKRCSMQTASGFNPAAAHMIVKRLIVAAIVLGAGSVLCSCGGGSEDGFSAYVADHWPHWAGGMPDDVPPRPGAPGYQQFIAHGQANQDVMPAPATGPSAPAVPPKPVVQTALPAPDARSGSATPPAAPVPAAAPAPAAPQSAAEDSSVVRGGLY